MLQKKQFSVEIAGKTLTIEVSALAEQANAAVIAKYGETVVLATAVMGRKEVDIDYLPLKVDYEEKFYAAGKIFGIALRAPRRPLVRRGDPRRPLGGPHDPPALQRQDAPRDPGGRHRVADRRAERSGVRRDCSASRPRSLSPTSRGTGRWPACASRRRRHDKQFIDQSGQQRRCRTEPADLRRVRLRLARIAST